jgi:hypothetical protein
MADDDHGRVRSESPRRPESSPWVSDVLFVPRSEWENHDDSTLAVDAARRVRATARL